MEKHRFVDRYSFKAVLTIITIIVLSVLDASFTLKLVEIGAAREANPLMDFFLGQGPIPFLIFKYFLTVGSVICVLIFKNFLFWKGKISGKALIVGILVLYAVLIFYELMIFYKYNQNTL